MLDKIKKALNKWKSKFDEYKKLDSIFSTLKLGNGDIEQYYDMLDSRKVGLRNLQEEFKKISEKDSKSHKKFILSLGEKDKNGKPRYKSIIEDTYRKIENRNKDVEKSERDLLEEVKLNSKNFIKNLIKELQKEENRNMKINGSRILDLIKILRGDCFLFNTVEKGNPKYIFFDKEYASKEILKQILQYENSTGREEDILISRRHVAKGADLNKMGDCLLKYKKFISYYLKELKPYVVSETWLNDTDFFAYYSNYLSRQGKKSQDKKTQDKKTLKNLALTKRLSIGPIKLSTLIQRGKTYEERRRRFVRDGSSLSRALEEYEKLGKQLQQGNTVLDLNKLS